MNREAQFALATIVLLAFVVAHLWSQGVHPMSFTVKATDIPQDGTIPKKHTCDGTDVSPGLSWTAVPTGTQSLALIVDDPDAPTGTWTHWLIWNIPGGNSLREGIPKVDELSDGTRQGRNDFKRVGYGGPCPPAGKPHRYFFKLYAMDTKLDVNAGASRNELERAMKGHVLAQAELMRRYGR